MHVAPNDARVVTLELNLLWFRFVHKKHQFRLKGQYCCTALPWLRAVLRNVCLAPRCYIPLIKGALANRLQCHVFAC